MKFINDDGVDVYAFLYELNYILGLPPFPTINTTRPGVGIYGLIDDVTAVLPLEDLKALLHKKMETRIYFKIPVTALKSPVLRVSIHYFTSISSAAAYVTYIILCEFF